MSSAIVREPETQSEKGYKAPNLLVSLILRFLSPLFQFIKVDPNYAALLQSYLSRGRVVFVMRVRSGIDFLYFNWLHRELGLPAPAVANGIHPIFYQSGRELARTTWQKIAGFLLPRPPKSYRTRVERMLFHVREQGLAMMFLTGSRRLIGGRRATTDPTPDLIRLQSEIDDDIFLVPQLILWFKDPEKMTRGPLDVVFGERDYPGLIRKVILLVRHHRNAFVKTGDPIALREFLAEHAGQRSEVVSKKLRRTLRVYLGREERVIRGPMQKPRARILRAILRDRDVVDSLRQIARDENVNYERIEKKAWKYLDEIAADYNIAYVQGLDLILTQVWKKLYDRFYIDEVGLERVREAARSGPLILVPAHRSHMDYLILSYLFFRHDLMPPHIAAGVNLSFWPLGPIFRRSGAFFLRRTFRGNRLYATMFEAYVRKMVREGFNIEFFIEGTRSRTGKLLPPKLGMLNMVADAVHERPDIKQAWVVPISIDYERIVEEGSYVKELTGGSKEKESFVGIIKASKHIRTNYGRVFVQFSEPIGLREYLAAEAPAKTEALPPPALSPAGESAENRPNDEVDLQNNADSNDSVSVSVLRRDVVERLGYQIIDEIRKVATVTFQQLVAAGLLAHHKRGLAREALVENLALLRDALNARDARFSTDFAGVDADLDRTLELFKNQRFITEINIAGQQVYAVDEERRLALDYYKNGILGHLYPLGFVAMAFLSNRRPTPEQIAVDWNFFTEIFEAELNLKYLDNLAEERQKALEFLEEREYIVFDQEAGEYQILRPYRVGLFQQLFLNFLESYYIVIVTVLSEAADGSVEQKSLAPRALEIGRLLYAKGDLGRAESTSKVNLDLAVKTLVHHGILEMRSAAPEAQRKRKKVQYYYLTERGRPWLEETKARLEEMLL